jgi:hypothetical protein
MRDCISLWHPALQAQGGLLATRGPAAPSNKPPPKLARVFWFFFFKKEQRFFLKKDAKTFVCLDLDQLG